ncbi:NYN domain-containing protein [Thermostichus sp. MS-CIW-30]
MNRASAFPLTWLWTGSLALGVTALVTRQAIWGLLPLAVAYPAIRRHEEQLGQALEQTWIQQQQTATRLETLQARFEALEARPTVDPSPMQQTLASLAEAIQYLERKTEVLESIWLQQQQQTAAQLETVQGRIDALEARPTSHLSVRQQLAPTTQAIQHIQQRLKAVELRLNALPVSQPQVTLEQLELVQAQLQHLQQLVASQPNPAFPRKALGVFIDAANLHASAQQWGSHLDYPSLLSWLAQGRSEMEVHVYSGVDRHNLAQRRFLRELRKQGYRVVTKPVVIHADGSRKANLDGELIVDLMAMHSHYETVLLLSGDGDFVPALKHIRRQGCRLEVAAYRPNTNPALIRIADQFVDLCAWQGTGTLVPLPAKQTPATG